MPTQLSSSQLLLHQKLLRACRDGNLQALEECLDDPTARRMVDAPAPVEDVDFGGETALHVVCDHVRVEVLVALLHEYRADPNVADSDGRTPLSRLVRLGTSQDDEGRKARMVHILLEYEADPNEVDSSGQTSVHAACQLGCLRHLQRLVASGGRVDKPDRQGWTPLALACSYGHFAVVHWVLSSARVDTNASGRGAQSPLAAACRAKNVNIMAVLLQYGIRFRAVSGVENVKDILARATNDKGQTVLHCLCADKSTSVDLVDDLLTFCGACINVNATDYRLRSPLHLACETNSLHVIRRLLQEALLVRDSPDGQGDTPLALTRCADVARALLLDDRLRKQPSSEVHRPNKKGVTPLQRASREGWSALLRVLLENGADPNGQPSALFHPAHRGDVGMVNLLLAHGADPNGTTPRQKPLLAASRNGHYPVVLRLTGAGADVNVADPATGATPLHLACQGGHVHIVEYLVREGGARLDVKDRAGRTPLEVAEQFRRREAAQSRQVKEADCSVPELPVQEISSRGDRSFSGEISYWKEQSEKHLECPEYAVEYY